MRERGTTIKICAIGSSQERRLGEIVLAEWPFERPFQESLPKLVRNFRTEAVVALEGADVLGGVYLTDHPVQLAIFREAVEPQILDHAIQFENFVVQHAHRGGGISRILIDFVKKTYLPQYSTILLWTRQPEMIGYYPKMGARALNTVSPDTRVQICGKDFLQEKAYFGFFRDPVVL